MMFGEQQVLDSIAEGMKSVEKEKRSSITHTIVEILPPMSSNARFEPHRIEGT